MILDAGPAINANSADGNIEELEEYEVDKEDNDNNDIREDARIPGVIAPENNDDVVAQENVNDKIKPPEPDNNNNNDSETIEKSSVAQE